MDFKTLSEHLIQYILKDDTQEDLIGYLVQQEYTKEDLCEMGLSDYNAMSIAFGDTPAENIIFFTDVLGIDDDEDPEIAEEIISDYLSDTYGYCHKGFDYVIEDGLIKVTNIDWDLR